MKTSARALTLLELLAVIAIIAVVAALLFPVFSRAKESSHDSGNTERMRQIVAAIHLYNADFDELMPYGINDGQQEMVSAPPFATVMRPYVKDAQLFRRSPAGTPRFRPSTSDYAYDSLAGLRLLRYSQIESGTTLLYYQPFQTEDTRTMRSPCFNYAGSVAVMSWLECQDKTTWIRDEAPPPSK